MPAISLDATAAAIASEPRRRIVERLATGPASVTDLAAHLSVSVPAVLKHLDRLVDGGLVTRVKDGRVVTVSLVPGSLEMLVEWATRTRLFWANHLDRYAAHLHSQASPDGSTP
ncbi:ArsR/SmtB family transcription factor [Pseudactinotalea terrae]|uniref:ArsR/SmtB family transcription factor n=1 Tax=Pseudactinotalea terrae TaxID=1743262 RepID=UPI0012E1EB5A|nr:metalloregulator ArsR/SmtB family transcription factor [Pseudactinotalea terrae]